MDALGFYNGGTEAGVSQAHKHLQLVPLPLGSEQAVPMAVLCEAMPHAPGVVRVAATPFRHVFSWIDAPGAVTGERLLQNYRALLAAAGIEGIARNGVLCQSAPYNLLVTRAWMLLVPRSRERFESISINALGYAGSLFVKNGAELARIREQGPMGLLAAVGCA